MKKAAEARPNLLLMEARKQRGWSKQVVADRIDTTLNNVSRWERGITFPQAHHRKALCNLFGKSETELGLVQKRNEVGLPATTILDPLIPAFPAGIDTLVGRDHELDYLKQQLLQSADTTRRVSALYGTPGVGKSALAMALAHDSAIREQFSAGILWGGVGPEPNILSLLSRWGTLLAVAPEANGESLQTCEDWSQALCMAIGARRMLIVIDDVWRLEDAWKLTVGGPNCTHIITTRFPEIALRYADKKALAIHELDGSNSLMMLTQWIPHVIAQEPEQIRDLVDSVGGLPLALLLVGKYLQVETRYGQQRRLQESLQKLSDPAWRLRLEQTEMQGGSSQSLSGIPRSVYTVIALSDRQLDEQGQATLRALSAFSAKPNTFSEAAALAVAGATTAALDALVDASLLEVSGAERYTIHQTISDYGKLQRGDMTLAVEQRLATFFIAYIESHQASYNDLAREMDNISRALHIAYERGMANELIRGACALTSFLLARGLYDDAELHLGRARQAAEKLGDETQLARVLLCIGRLTERHEELRQAVPLYEQGLVIARDNHDNDLVLSFQINLGEVLLNLGDLAAAETYVREGLALAHDDQAQRCKLLKTLGEIVDDRGEFARADALYGEALEIARAIRDKELMSALMQNLGAKAFKENRFDEADACCLEGLALARDIGSLHRQSALLMNLGMTAIRKHHYAQAENYCREALAIARDIKNALRMSNALQNFGILEGLRLHYAQAEAYLDESIELARKINHQWLISEGLGELGEVYLRQQKIEQAQRAFDEALDIARAKQFQELSAVALYGQARVAKERGDYAQARLRAEEARNILASEGHYKLDEVTRWLHKLPASPKGTL